MKGRDLLLAEMLSPPKDLPLVPLVEPLFQTQSFEIYLLNLSNAHEVINGNKWFKLKYHLLAAHQLGATSLLSFGGIHSNHLRALAKACRRYNFSCIAVIRGEKPAFETPTLVALGEANAQIHFVGRTEYRNAKAKIAQGITSQTKEAVYIIDEGGFGEEALKGSAEIANYIPDWVTEVWLPVGSGATLAGLAIGLAGRKVTIKGISAVKGLDNLTSKIESIIGDRSYANFSIDFNWHQGGFAKTTAEITAFQELWQVHYPFPIEHVYNAKGLLALQKTMQAQPLAEPARIVYIHTGGIDF